MQKSKALVVGLYLNAALLVGVIVCLLGRNGGPMIFTQPAYGQQQAPIAGGAGVFIMPGQLTSNSWGCYLLDVDAQTLCTYQFRPGDQTLRLLAARSYRYDRQLSNMNTEPAPADIRQLLEKERQPIRTNSQPEGESAPTTGPEGNK